MPDVTKNDPELVEVWMKAFDLGLVGSDTAFVIVKDERGIIRIERRIERAPKVERV
jgi:hypothetical protein